MAEIWIIIKDRKPLPEMMPCGCRSPRTPDVLAVRDLPTAKTKRLKCRDCGRAWTRHDIGG